MPNTAKPLAHLITPDVMERFESKTRESSEPIAACVDTPCIEWTAYRLRGGYGRINVGGSMQLAHRVAFVAVNGDPPPEHEIAHLCERPYCVNTEHLRALDYLEHSMHDEGFIADNATRSECPRGHSLDDPANQMPSGSKRGQRSCWSCSREKASLIRRAAASLGLTWREYTARYGWSAKTAKIIIETARYGWSAKTAKTIIEHGLAGLDDDRKVSA